MSPIFVYVLQFVLLKTKFDLITFTFVVGSVGFSVVIIWLNIKNAEEEDGNKFLGVMEILVSSLLAAVYKIQAFRWFSPHPTEFTMKTLQKIGVYGFVVSLGLSLIIDIGIGGGGVVIDWEYQLLHMSFSVMFNVSINWGASKVAPIIVSLGTILGVPLVPLFLCVFYEVCEGLDAKGIVGVGLLGCVGGAVWRIERLNDLKKNGGSVSGGGEEEQKNLV